MLQIFLYIYNWKKLKGASKKEDNYFNEVDKLKKELDSKRPIPEENLRSLEEFINLEWIYNSNGIEGNTLTLRETQVVLEWITVGGESIREHLEAINHEKAILYLNDLVKENNPITEWYSSISFKRHR